MMQSVSTAGLTKETVIKPINLLPEDLSQCLTLVAEQQNKKAFTILFHFFSPKIVRFGIRKLGNEALAKELVQETMSSIWQKAHLFKPDKGAATTWVYTIMRNTAFDMMRKRSFRDEQSYSDDIWPLDSVQDPVHDEDSFFEDHLESRQLFGMIEQLPEAQKVAIRGYYYQGLSHEQLAQQLDVSVGTIKSRIRLGLQKLKQHMGGAHHD